MTFNELYNYYSQKPGRVVFVKKEHLMQILEKIRQIDNAIVEVNGSPINHVRAGEEGVVIPITTGTT